MMKSRPLSIRLIVFCLTVLPSVAVSQVVKKSNVTFDLSRVTDRGAQIRIQSALELGYRSASAGGRNVGDEITHLRGNNKPRTIRFFSNEAEASPGLVGSGAPAVSLWSGPLGLLDMISPPSTRTQIRIFINPGQPYWYLVNSLWHELLHVTLNVTHHQTNPEGSVPDQYVNDSVWYSTINKIMRDFPTHARDPVSGEEQELYNVDNNPWA